MCFFRLLRVKFVRFVVEKRIAWSFFNEHESHESHEPFGIANRTLYHFVFATKVLTNDYFFIFFFRHAKRKTLEEVE